MVARANPCQVIVSRKEIQVRLSSGGKSVKENVKTGPGRALTVECAGSLQRRHCVASYVDQEAACNAELPVSLGHLPLPISPQCGQGSGRAGGCCPGCGEQRGAQRSAESLCSTSDIHTDYTEC